MLTFTSHRWWLDLHTPACLTNVQTIMKKRIELAKVGTGYWCFSSFGAEVASNWQSKGCDAVEPDNTDSYTNGAGWQTTSTLLSCTFSLRQ